VDPTSYHPSVMAYAMTAPLKGSLRVPDKLQFANRGWGTSSAFFAVLLLDIHGNFTFLNSLDAFFTNFSS